MAPLGRMADRGWTPELACWPAVSMGRAYTAGVLGGWAFTPGATQPPASPEQPPARHPARVVHRPGWRPPVAPGGHHGGSASHGALTGAHSTQRCPVAGRPPPRPGPTCSSRITHDKRAQIARLPQRWRWQMPCTSRLIRRPREGQCPTAAKLPLITHHAGGTLYALTDALLHSCRTRKREHQASCAACPH